MEHSFGKQLGEIGKLIEKEFTLLRNNLDQYGHLYYNLNDHTGHIGEKGGSDY